MAPGKPSNSQFFDMVHTSLSSNLTLSLNGARLAVRNKKLLQVLYMFSESLQQIEPGLGLACIKLLEKNLPQILDMIGLLKGPIGLTKLAMAALVPPTS